MDIQIFKNKEFGEIRTAGTPENPEFCLADICKSLDLRVDGVVARLTKDTITAGVLCKKPVQTNGGIQQMYFVNEDGLYDVILDSRKPEAKRFRKWITSEVLPSIRKHGAYITPSTLDNLLANPDTAIRLFTELKNERTKNSELAQANAVLNQQVLELTPKADYYDAVLNSPSTLTVGEFSKDYGMSATGMNRLLNRLGIQYKQNGVWLLYQKYAPRGWTQTAMVNFTDQKGIIHTKPQTRWTQKGRLELYNILKNNGYLPLIEQDSDGGYYE